MEMELNELLMSISMITFFLYFLWRFWGKILNKQEPDLQDVDEDIENIFVEMQEIKTKQNLFHQEIFEYMDGVMTPLNKRMNQRLRREQQTDLKDEGDSRRGIIGFKRKVKRV